MKQREGSRLRTEAADEPPIVQEYLTTEQAARLLGLSRKTLENRRSSGFGGPPYIRLGRTIRYARTDLANYMKDRLVVPGECLNGEDAP